MIARARRYWWRYVRRYEWEICQVCGRPASRGLGSYWTAPNVTWRRIEDNVVAIRCGECFVADAEAKGETIAWLAARMHDIDAAANRIDSDGETANPKFAKASFKPTHKEKK